MDDAEEARVEEGAFRLRHALVVGLAVLGAIHLLLTTWAATTLHLGMDLRAALAMSIAGTQVDLIVQIFNILNSLDVRAADQRALTSEGLPVFGTQQGAVFARPVSYQSPRRFEFGLRFSV